MLDTEPGTGEAPAADTTTPAESRPTRRRRATKATAEPASGPAPGAATPAAGAPAEGAPAPAKKTTRTRRKAAAAAAPATADAAVDSLPADAPARTAPAQTAAPPQSAPTEAARGDTAPAAATPPQTAPSNATRTGTAPAATAPPQTARNETARAGAAATTPNRAASTEAAQAGTPSAEAAAPAKRTTRRRKAAAAAPPDASAAASPAAPPADMAAVPAAGAAGADAAPVPPALVPPPVVTFMAPDATATTVAPTRRRTARKAAPAAEAEPAGATVTAPQPGAAEPGAAEPGAAEPGAEPDEDVDAGGRRRRRGRRGRGKGRAEGENGEEEASDTDTAEPEPAAADTDQVDEDGEQGPPSKRRRRRRRRGGAGDEGEPDDPPNTVVHVREVRPAGDEVQSVKGSTRLEAKRQRRREGRETQRRRPPILSEAEFLARREAVERQMVVRQAGERTQIAVLEDGVLVEHYVTKSGSMSYAGNVYLGKVQNVLPSMEAAFIDIGKGRNAVLYAGEVNWDVSGLEGKARSIEQALRSGDSVLVQVTKDPIGHKGARLTSQISLPGRYLVYVPGGSMTGISRKLPDTERQRLKDILKRIVPDDAGVIIRTAAEGASEEELSRDVTRLQAQWQVIQEKAAKGGAPALLSEEPDLAIRVVRDVFNEDFASIVVSGDEASETLEQYISHVAPDLLPRLRKYTADTDVFHDLRIDEQLMKALDRKVWLPSGGSLVIDRTEAMTVVDVNTGKFTGKGGNLEETVTRNNLEAAEEIVRQLRLRDVGGIIVIDFIDMVLESNRDLVLRRLMECLGRDRTKHQVAEVTSLGLVQMTRKRVGQGLLEAFSEPCEVCKGRGIIIYTEPVEESRRRTGTTPRKAEPTLEPTAEPREEPRDQPREQPAKATRSRRGRKATASTEPAEAPLPTEAPRSTEAPRPTEAPQSAEASQPGEPSRSAELPPSAEAPQPAEAPEDAVEAEPAEVARAASAAAGLPTDTLDDAASASEEPDVEPIIEAAGGPPAPRKRRRRVASRPAGPPVPATSG